MFNISNLVWDVELQQISHSSLFLIIKFYFWLLDFLGFSNYMKHQKWRSLLLIVWNDYSALEIKKKTHITNNFDSFKS